VSGPGRLAGSRPTIARPAGPTQPPPAGELRARTGGGSKHIDLKNRILRLSPRRLDPNGNVTVGVTLDSRGTDVAATVFTIVYDPSKLSSPVVRLSSKASSGIALTVNDRTPGRLTILIDSVDAIKFTELASVSFTIASDVSFGPLPISFDQRSISAASSLGEAVRISGVGTKY